MDWTFHMIERDLTFCREQSGDVSATMKIKPLGATGVHSVTIANKDWPELVARMTKFGSRPGDTKELSDHHMGVVDILEHAKRERRKRESEQPFASGPAEAAYQALLRYGGTCTREQFRPVIMTFAAAEDASKCEYGEWKRTREMNRLYEEWQRERGERRRLHPLSDESIKPPEPVKSGLPSDFRKKMVDAERDYPPEEAIGVANPNNVTPQELKLYAPFANAYAEAVYQTLLLCGVTCTRKQFDDFYGRKPVFVRDSDERPSFAIGDGIDDKQK